MSDIEIFNQRLKSESFSGQKVNKFIAVESEFLDCSFQDMIIKDICFGGGTKQTKYVNCTFDNTSFSSNVLGVARFENCSFKNVKVKKFFCIDAEFINCVFSGEIKQGNFVGKHRDVDGKTRTNEIQDNDFTGLVFGDVGFTNIDLSMQKFTQNENLAVITDVSSFISNIKSEVEKITDFAMYDSAVKVLTILEMESDGGNNQMLVDKLSFPKKLQEAAELVLSYRKLEN
ncbi:hypothetical protein AN214_04251 [Pseudoalteromonas sp. P1-9]|uniref:hypothetical protein n=1 Tax=Pseudoalteromonas sp. P1-9 TaxID=1710354 RepID=UPI0006D5F143|nr:hypothetical protein [Pseudoalteromonas sp. P1-9]KPV93713.1 hypothetical protein AN214_04251 [Pseudoalteromonas sp. P1-9]